MLFRNDDGTYTGGPLDVLCILHDVVRGTYHPAFFEEAPFPGPHQDVQNMKIVRLKSRMHHTTGSSDLPGALVQLDEMITKIEVPSENIWREPRPWDGSQGIVWVEPNWRLSTDAGSVTPTPNV